MERKALQMILKKTKFNSNILSLFIISIISFLTIILLKYSTLFDVLFIRQYVSDLAQIVRKADSVQNAQDQKN